MFCPLIFTCKLTFNGDDNYLKLCFRFNYSLRRFSFTQSIAMQWIASSSISINMKVMDEDLNINMNMNAHKLSSSLGQRHVSCWRWFSKCTNLNIWLSIFTIDWTLNVINSVLIWKNYYNYQMNKLQITIIMKLIHLTNHIQMTSSISSDMLIMKLVINSFEQTANIVGVNQILLTLW